MNSKYKYLFKNIGLLTLSNFGTKLLVFFLVPLYTAVLSTEEFGTFDLFNSTINLLIPILSLNIVESVLRFSIEYHSKRSDIFSIGFFHVLNCSLLVILAVWINHIFSFSIVLKEYSLFFVLMFVTTAFLGGLVNFSRGIDRIREVAIGGVIGSAAIIALNIIFLLVLHMRLEGYFLAHILGTVIQSAYLLVRIKIWKYTTIRFDKGLQKEMRKYSIPMIANTVGWWVNNVSDRYVVTFFCGLGINGIYSVAYKIPSILQVFQTIFNQAWTLSAVRDYTNDDQSGFFEKMYNLYNFSMVVICSLLIIFSRLMARLLYAKEFYNAWVYVPLLLISVVFGAMAGYIGGIFAAVKDSKIYAKSTVVGAVVNIVLNIVLVYFMGAMGAAIATAFSYFVVWVIRLKHVKRYMKLKLKLLRDGAAYMALLIQSILVITLSDRMIVYLPLVGLFLLILLLFHSEAKSCLASMMRVGKNERHV